MTRLSFPPTSWKAKLLGRKPSCLRARVPVCPRTEVAGLPPAANVACVGAFWILENTSWPPDFTPDSRSAAATRSEPPPGGRPPRNTSVTLATEPSTSIRANALASPATVALIEKGSRATAILVRVPTLPGKIAPESPPTSAPALAYVPSELIWPCAMSLPATATGPVAAPPTAPPTAPATLRATTPVPSRDDTPAAAALFIPIKNLAAVAVVTAPMRTCQFVGCGFAFSPASPSEFRRINMTITHPGHLPSGSASVTGLWAAYACEARKEGLPMDLLASSLRAESTPTHRLVRGS